MSEWQEPVWRIPRKEEIVKNNESILGRVTRSEGTIQKRNLWIEDINGLEIHSGEPAELFETVDGKTTIDFQIERHKLKGYFVGAICSYKGNTDIPLEILSVNWNLLRNRLMVSLRDFRKFEGDPMVTDNVDILKVFSPNYPDIENLMSDNNTGLKYRIDVSLIEKNNTGWTNCGSPWEFLEKKDALHEIEVWKARLKIRRVASVFNTGWDLKFPCWGIELKEENDKLLSRVNRIEASTGAPGYFKTALDAALAVQLIPVITWKIANGFSIDTINLKDKDIL
jgi:hypothetical protein